MRYQFGYYILDTQLYELRHMGQLVKLEPQVFKVLAYLVEHRERIVSQAELLNRLWPEQFPGDAVLTRCIWVARQAVGDSGRHQLVIQTVPRRGYRLIVPVVVLEPEGLEVSAAAIDSLRQDDSGVLCAHYVSATVSSISQASQDERKAVTVLCVRWLCDWGLDLNVDLDALHETWQEVIAVVREAVNAYEGMIHEFTSQRVMIVFGAPIRQEDHAVRAVLTARELMRALDAISMSRHAQSEKRIELCMGISSGPVALQLDRAESDAIMPVSGEAPSLAILLAEQAPLGVVCLSGATAPLVTDHVTLSPSSPVWVEGHESPVEIYRLERLDTRCATRIGDEVYQAGPFVGRGEELNSLSLHLTRVLNGQGQVVGIVGEPGIGKTRLLHEFRQYAIAAGALCLTGKCQPGGRPTPYLPLIDWVRQSCQVADVNQLHESREAIHATLCQLGLESDRWTPILLHWCGVVGASDPLAHYGPQERRVQLFAILQQLFLQSSRCQPLVLMLEDLHWIDSTSEAWLSELVARLAGAPLFILLTYRPGFQPTWLGASTVSQLALLPLSVEESSQIVARYLPTAVNPTPMQERIVSQGGGNPFFLEELSRMADQHDDVEAPLVVPKPIQAMLLARVDRLPAAANHLLQTASAVGGEIDAAVLRALVELGDSLFQESLLYLQSTGFLIEIQVVPGILYAFRHQLMQEISYQSMLRPTRQWLHRKIAEVLTIQFPQWAETHPERISEHYLKAGCSG